jgi:histidyl-tRNA synthetase
MGNLIQSVKGMPDILPVETPLWHAFEATWHKLISSYGYDEIRMPLIEETRLFKRSIGDATDIVEKEMFSFLDRDEVSLTLRPEGTASCVRAGLEHGLLFKQVQRLWYTGSMFRYEKPQKGRYRQFHQMGVEAFGLAGPDIDVEQILMMHRLWKMLGIEGAVSLQINNLGNKSSRAVYREKLVDYLNKYKADLDEDSQRRLLTNPLRILDSKNPKMVKIIENAPKSFDYLNDECKKHFETFQSLLTEAKVPYSLNSGIVRGLDYYNRIVYEWVTDKLGSQGTICAGGRYDGLVEELGGESTPACGFALGIERVILLQKALEISKENLHDIYFISVGEEARKRAILLSEQLRDGLPTLRFMVHFGEGSFKNQFKKADKSGAQIALIIGEEEIVSGNCGVKFLREDKAQLSLQQDALSLFLNDYFGRKR